MMSAHIQQTELISARYQTRYPRVTPIAFSFGVIITIALLSLGMPFLVSASLWLMGMALVLIAYAFVSNYRFAIPAWDTAIAGQIIGFLGMGLLLLANLI